VTYRNSTLLSLGGLLLLAVVTPAVADDPAATGTCNDASKLKFIASTKFASTSSSAYQSIPQATVGFIQGGTDASCVIVRFSAVIFAPATNVETRTIAIQPLLDNSIFAAPSVAVFSTGDKAAPGGAHSYEFVFPSVAPGPHRITMQFSRGGLDGGSDAAQIFQHTTMVQYAP
jgi:hypothetical protein